MKAHLVGGGIASLAAAAHLIKDGGLLGKNIHIYEATDQLGGALDAAGSSETGYRMRGGRMFEEKYSCTYELLSFIPSISDPSRSVKDETMAFHETHGWYDKARLVTRDGRIADFHRYGLSRRDRLDLIRLAATPEAFLDGKRVSDCFSPAFFETNFWFIYATIFAFVPWYSAIEMRRYMRRFLHLFPTMADMSSVYRTRFSQFEAIVVPLMKWLAGKGVNLVTGTRVTHIDFMPSAEEITASRLVLLQGGQTREVGIAAQDLLFVTNGSMVADASWGSMTSAPEQVTAKRDGSWALWQALARGRKDFGQPGVFSDHTDQSTWESFTVTCRDTTFLKRINMFSGSEAGRGGLITFKDSNWLLTIAPLHHPYFTDQPRDVFVWWGYGLYPDKPGNYVTKPMRECSGAEILEEVLRHLKFDADLDGIAGSSNCIPCLMPYIGSVFMVRRKGDRPNVVPTGSTNFAFIGQFTEMPEDVPFTVEYSVRSAQTAVCALLKLNRKPVPVYKGRYHPRMLYRAFKALQS